MSFKYIVRFYAICYTRSERSCLHNNPNSRKTLITLCHIVRFYAICYTRSERSCLHNSPMYSMASASLFRTLCRLFFVRSWDQHIVLWLLFFSDLRRFTLIVLKFSRCIWVSWWQNMLIWQITTCTISYLITRKTTEYSECGRIVGSRSSW